MLENYSEKVGSVKKYHFTYKLP